ncbi:MAG: PilT/PilU family type 4a pilus ATPase [Oligoflexia bacterium]|nr:PilT/PilU family type 4a pilus ATPase [Oligoflexia bacterium]
MNHNLPPTAVPNRQSLLELLGAMEQAKASDLFLNEGKAPAARINGRVRTLNHPPVGRGDLMSLLQSALSKSAMERFKANGDVDASMALPDGRRFRLNALREQGRIGIVARAVPSGAISIDELGLPEAARVMADNNRGLVLITGATGSGKSTTLASMINYINETRDVHIVTIEDPIEFVYHERRARITQREVGIDTPDFHAALKAVLRQSPDVILIGELRDKESVHVAMQAALTGHLVFATLHTVDTSQTVQRIISMFPEHMRDQVALDLSLSLKGVLSQRLVPKADGSGRVVVTETLVITPPAQMLLKAKDIGDLQDFLRTSTDQHTHSFNWNLLQLINDRTITVDVGLAYSTLPEELALNVKGMSSGSGTVKGVLEGGEAAGFDMQALLTEVTKRGASDLHLTVARPPILRVSGQLVPLGRANLTETDMRMLLHSIMTARQRTAYELERELDFAIALDEDHRFRVNAYFQRGVMAAALRSIAHQVPSAEELGIPKVVLDMGLKPHGLLLVVGPTGSGKSTTLACLVDQINRTRAVRIMTIEDPVEYVHTGVMSTIDQREVGADTLSFSAALKYILRQDPDVILVGEMRDLDTMSACLTAAETGHLVLATLHSNEATQAIDRIVDVFPSHAQGQVRSQLAASLVGVVAQRLLKRRDNQGRVAAIEVLVANAAIKNLIRENKMHQAASIMETGKRDGNITLDNALEDLLRKGKIDRATAMLNMKDKAKVLQSRGGGPGGHPGSRGGYGSKR